MFDQSDIENLGMEFENGLKMGRGNFTDEQIKTLKMAFEMAMFYGYKMIEDWVVLKDTQSIR